MLKKETKTCGKLARHKFRLAKKPIYQTPFKTTLYTTLRTFQYKIIYIMGILPTNTLP